MSRATPPRRRRAVSAVDEAFAAEMAELERKHHEAWLARPVGDGLVIVEVRDPKTGEVLETRREQGHPAREPRHDWAPSRLKARG